ncbi:hypothetical protein ACVWW2_002636 [Bradyrhizobium sp. LM4.3]
MHGGAAEWIDADIDAGGFDEVEIDHVAEIGDVGRNEVVGVDVRSLARPGVVDAVHALEAIGEIAIGALLDHGGRVGVGRPTMRRIVLVAAVLRRIM